MTPSYLLIDQKLELCRRLERRGLGKTNAGEDSAERDVFGGESSTAGKYLVCGCLFKYEKEDQIPIYYLGQTWQ